MSVIPRHRELNIIGRKYVWFTVSGLVILVAIIALFTRGLNFGIEFTGGTEMDAYCQPGTTLKQVRGVMDSFGYGEAKIQQVTNVEDTRFTVTVQGYDQSKNQQVKAALVDKDGIIDATFGDNRIEVLGDKDLKPQDIESVLIAQGYPAQSIEITQDEMTQFLIRTPEFEEGKNQQIEDALRGDAGAIFILEPLKVGPGWGSQVTRQAVIALAVFLVAILIYISLRFDFKMAICSIVALFHDVLVTVGVYSLVGREVNPATIIAVLTILGYSLYDTIVIFDRVKENTDQLTRQSRKTYSQTVNDSMNQVLARSINTSLTTLIPIVSILFFGGETLKAFAFALFVGVLAGTYSSIFVASPLLSMWKETEPKYRAYRERVERKRAREAKVREKKRKKREKAKAGPSGEPEAKPTAQKAEPAPQKPGPAPHKPVEKKPGAAKPKATAKKAPEARPKPKPKAKGGGGQKPKTSPKARTKGPGSGKKKKKKKKR